MVEKKFDKQKLFSVAVTAILIFFFVGGFWIGLDRVRSMEGTFPPNDIKEGISAAPETAEDAVKYLDYVINKALTEKPKLSSDDNFSVDSSSLETDGSDTFKSTLLFAMDGFEDHISSVEDTEGKLTSVNFGEDISSLLRVPSLEGLIVSEFSCNYIYYECPSCGITNNEQLSSCEPCGSEREYYKKYRPEYEIELSFSPDIIDTAPEAFEANFPVRTEDEINALTSEISDGLINDGYRGASADSLKLIGFDKSEISYNSFKIYFKVNRLTDEISYLRYVKGIDVNADVTFLGRYKDLGSCSVGFSMNEYKNFSFTWPALTLNKELVEIEPKSTDNLLATLTCEDPLAMTVSWVSSDESIATVDADGYIDTSEKTGEAVITASYEYLGKTYSDTCLVKVKTPVESMKMSKKNISLEIGETFELSTKISPKKATIQTVKWYSENEAVAVVDEYGVVSAVGEGTVIVYALSDDGYFRSTCEVTVE
ncbi:MAG: Ig-like domain-containing protein [Clostridia bacterium]|nr:Ig-like domain-containing protein [Clostridia bacterium]